MAFSKAVRKILFTRDRKDQNSPFTPPQTTERRPRPRSSTTAWWWRNESSSRERPHISGPFDPFPKLAPEAESFDAQITLASLSDILIWYVYYDVVEKNVKWFEALPSECMLGWIGLGMELKRTNSLPSKTLHLACDGLGIDAGQVAARLVRLSDRSSMLHSELDPNTTYESQLEKLQSDLKLVKSLRPTPQTQFERCKKEIELCIRDYFRVVYYPVVHVGQFDPGPATTMEESCRRNDVRKRLKQVFCVSRDLPPKYIYDQAQKPVVRDSVTFHQNSVRALGDSDRNHPRSSFSNGVERGRSRSNGVELDQSTTRRRSAPDLIDLERVLNRMRAQCTRYAEDLRQFRLQQEDAFAIQRADSFLQHEAAYHADTNINDHGNRISGNGHGTSHPRQPGTFPSSFSERLPSSTELGIRRFSHNPTGATIINAANSYESYSSRQSECRSPEWLQKQHEDDMLADLPFQGHSYHSDEPSSHPITRRRPISGKEPSHHRAGVESKLANEALEQQYDAKVESDNINYRVPDEAWSSLTRHSLQPSNLLPIDESSYVTNRWATLGPIAALPSKSDGLRLEAHSPTLTHKPSLFMTPPSSPTMSMLNMPWRRMPGAWPPASEAEPSQLGSPLLATSPPVVIHDPVRRSSRASMAGFTDMTDPGELTAAEAIRYQTGHAMASMVDLNALPSRSSRSYERRCGVEANGDVEREQPEEVK